MAASVIQAAGEINECERVARERKEASTSAEDRAYWQGREDMAGLLLIALYDGIAFGFVSKQNEGFLSDADLILIDKAASKRQQLRR